LSQEVTLAEEVFRQLKNALFSGMIRGRNDTAKRAGENTSMVSLAQRMLQASDLDLDSIPAEYPPMVRSIRGLLRHQETNWPLLREARDRWFRSVYREISLGPFSVLLQHNAMREQSVSARVDPLSIEQRPCFLCSSNMPTEERGLRVGCDLMVFFNPFPILYPHPVFVHRRHIPQRISDCLSVMLDMARECRGEYTMLYNGPRCGASAPDHLHFQGIPRYRLPVEADVFTMRHDPRFHGHREGWPSPDGVDVWTPRDFGRAVIILTSPHQDRLEKEFRDMLRQLPGAEDGDEPMINLLCWFEEGEWSLCLFPRKKHRPAVYSVEPGTGILLSPGAIDMGGLLVTPRAQDFATLTSAIIHQIFREVSGERAERPLPARNESGDRSRRQASMSVPREQTEPLPGLEPSLAVGIMSKSSEIELRLPAVTPLLGEELSAGWVRLNRTAEGWSVHHLDSGKQRKFALQPLFLTPRSGEPICFRGVTIGIDFHWEQRQELAFPGTAEIRPAEDRSLTVVNHVPLEEYLACVVSSEMSGDAPSEFLMAHAVISRSWLLAQLAIREHPRILRPEHYPAFPDQVLTWTERSRHTDFDVCADDHCQRYQGVSRIRNPQVRQAVAQTRGMVLAAAGYVCDTRFSKCCGGHSDSFRVAWGDLNPPGIAAVYDGPSPGRGAGSLGLESAARRWIEKAPAAYCNTTDPELLATILPDFDRQTRDFFRWRVRVPRPELESIICRKTGWDPGELREIVPLRRGHSGRLERILLVGSRGHLLLGKELEIRRALSESHLYSSAFIVRTDPAGSGRPDSFEFEGAGWGHGVGLCQIGAAVMAHQGLTASRILKHYFPQASLIQWYG
jgi:peptidoglycan hydrolase-like amidase